MQFVVLLQVQRCWLCHSQINFLLKIGKAVCCEYPLGSEDGAVVLFEKASQSDRISPAQSQSKRSSRGFSRCITHTVREIILDFLSCLCSKEGIMKYIFCIIQNCICLKFENKCRVIVGCLPSVTQVQYKLFWKWLYLILFYSMQFTC